MLVEYGEATRMEVGYNAIISKNVVGKW